VWHRVRGGRSADTRGIGRRRQGHSPVAGRREAEQEEALVSGGGVGWRMQWCEVRRAARDRASGMGSIGRDGGGGGRRHRVERAGEQAGNEGSGGQAGRAGSNERCGVSRSGARVGQAGDAGVRARGGTPGSVGRLDCCVQVMNSTWTSGSSPRVGPSPGPKDQTNQRVDRPSHLPRLPRVPALSPPRALTERLARLPHGPRAPAPLPARAPHAARAFRAYARALSTRMPRAACPCTQYKIAEFISLFLHFAVV
jgi:hypothetical protein